MAMDKNYEPKNVEARLYQKWESSGAFACGRKPEAEPFCIMMPPPNVTGNLHIGHALTFTVQDIVVRYQRMKGKDVLWQPGTDHAGIATQMVVERQLAAHNLDRRTMGRAAFLDKVWAWKAESGGAITGQLRRLGASCDWSRERFTMDDGLSKAVTHEFVELHKKGLIYKDKRLVNWDPKLLTAVSDLEVEMKEVKGNLWHIRYAVAGTEEGVVVATTRPETMFGDTAVAIHPENPALKHLIGKEAILPIVGRAIPIVADDYADPEKGTGAVKITPAHDFNDFAVGKRHKLPMINVMDQHGCLNDAVPADYQGIERFAARKKLVVELEAMGALVKVEPHTHTVPHGDRSGVVIEPWLSEQWYCDAGTLAKEALAAVEDGRTRFVPEGWVNTYYAWMRNIEPWCISRQLWWGHQIPAWYAADGKCFVAVDEETAMKDAAAHYGAPTALTRDEDVLDTWFSSALWPFSTLDWPQATPELSRYYPTSVLVTGFDIIFFWVARMMMMGLHFTGKVPFKDVYIHGLVRDEKGQKMSKTKGNVIDPLTIIDQYGCDALRFTLAALSTPGRDIKLATSRIEGNRNFVTKLWNAARFCEMNGCVVVEGFNPATVQHPVNMWIVGEVKAAVERVASNLDTYRFDLAANAGYDFVWSSFCDWYLEFTKPILQNGRDAEKAETRATTAWVLSIIVPMLHPIMPYVTEALWEGFFGRQDMLMTASWPEVSGLAVNQTAADEIAWLVRTITAIRTTRAELNVPPSAKVPLHIVAADAAMQARFVRQDAVLRQLARLSDVTHVASAVGAAGAAQTVVDGVTLRLPLADVIDIGAERARLTKEGEKWQAEIRKVDAKLGNPDFVSRAPAEVIDEHRERKAEAEVMVAKLTAAIQSLAG